MAQFDLFIRRYVGQTLTKLLAGRSYSASIMCDSHPKKQKWLSADNKGGCIYDDIKTVMSTPKCVVVLAGLGGLGPVMGRTRGRLRW